MCSSDLHSMAFCNDDPAMETYLDENPVALHVGISDDQGNVLWEQEIEEINISSFAITEYYNWTNLPLMLEVGQNYQIFYSCDELSKQSLTIAVYGLEKDLLPQFLVVCILIMLLLMLTIYFTFDSNKIKGCKAFVIIYMILGDRKSVV